jgi:hypothetical protein
MVFVKSTCMQTLYWDGPAYILNCMQTPLYVRAVLFGALASVASPLAAQQTGQELGSYAHPLILVNVMTVEGKPVEDALVRIRAAGRIARTNWMGEASMVRVGYGTKTVEVLRLGYAPAVVDLNITSDTVAAQFVLEKLVDTLSTMWITAARPSMPAANLAEFNQRKRMGIGRFVEDTVFEKHQLQDLSLVLPRLLVGLRAAPDPVQPGKYVLKSTRNDCVVDVFLDGFLLSEDFGLLKPTDIAGAEWYTKESAPPQFRRVFGGCRILLLWSRW